MDGDQSRENWDPNLHYTIVAGPANLGDEGFEFLPPSPFPVPKSGMSSILCGLFLSGVSWMGWNLSVSLPADRFCLAKPH